MKRASYEYHSLLKMLMRIFQLYPMPVMLGKNCHDFVYFFIINLNPKEILLFREVCQCRAVEASPCESDSTSEIDGRIVMIVRIGKCCGFETPRDEKTSRIVHMPM